MFAELPLAAICAYIVLEAERFGDRGLSSSTFRPSSAPLLGPCRTSGETVQPAGGEHCAEHEQDGCYDGAVVHG
jgi:hypothetical protein